MSTFCSLREAATYAGVSYITIRDWAINYGIGELVDGRWHVNKERLDAYVIARSTFKEVQAELRRQA